MSEQKDKKYKFIADLFRISKKILFVSIVLLLISLTFVFALNSFSDKNTLKVTNEHPFLINNQWIKASELEVGDELTTAYGKKARIISIEDVDESVDVYNLEVEKYSDFVVNGIVVHNSNNPDLENKFLGAIKQEELRLYPINERGLKADYEHARGIFNRNSISSGLGGKNQYITYEAWRDQYFGNVGRSVNLLNNLNDGKFYFYGSLAGEENGIVIWAINNKGEFGVALRPTKVTGYDTLPHSVLAGGNPVYGGGEIIFKDGMAYRINAYTGHYYDIANPAEFSKNSIKAFERYAEAYGLKIHPDFAIQNGPLVIGL